MFNSDKNKTNTNTHTDPKKDAVIVDPKQDASKVAEQAKDGVKTEAKKDETIKH